MNWLERQIALLGEIGGLPQGGISRPALSTTERRAHDFVATLMQDSGMTVRTDAALNTFGRIGTPGAPVIMSGSHLDTVPQGGRFDGALGVLAALAVARSLAPRLADGEFPLAFEVVAFTGEESSRFGQTMFGSKGFTGSLDISRLESIVDANGVTVKNALIDLGVDARALDRPTMTEPPRAFIELHIEQGTILRDADVPVGIVNAIAAPTRLSVWIEGKASHSGASLPSERKDALVAAAQVISEIEALMKREETWLSVATVGRVRVMPNVINVVPGEVELGIDIRGSDPGSKHRLVRAIDKLLARVSARRGLSVMRQAVADEEPVTLDEKLFSLETQAAQEASVVHQKVVSMAGHDSMLMARICPTGMVFVRNRSGISHNPAEEIAREDVEAGCRVLEKSIEKLLSGSLF